MGETFCPFPIKWPFTLFLLRKIKVFLKISKKQLYKNINKFNIHTFLHFIYVYHFIFKTEKTLLNYGTIICSVF